MKTRVLAAAVSTVVLTGTLSGCMTVHGQNAVVPATTEAEAQKVLDKYVAAANKAFTQHDLKLNATVERGALGEGSQAYIRTLRALDPERKQTPQPVKVKDSKFHIPQQAGWPKFFVVDTASNVEQSAGSGENRLLLAFTRQSADERWKASYQAVVAAGDVPEFAEDEDGHADDVPMNEDGGLITAPGDLSKAYTSYLGSGEGDFADGPQTTGKREKRAKVKPRKGARTEFADLAANNKIYAPFALRTRSGDALAFFTMHQHTKQTVAPNIGIRPPVRPGAKALLEGEAKLSLTEVFVLQQLVRVPTVENRSNGIVFLSQTAQRTAAKGE
ncbi:hypothetical protein JGS22_017425 [Streptomyces sp. P38-E01]|uniref:DUF8094 domain-containing protein n=1 Tax=Streptomyces tardus TaxID=2780544 RepID=A0A949N6R6_9ACTN|nr:hypothetical protein [Streptomyces tardus]MBU7599347.1 hypothetical protein [Streptomyces tardus]